MTDAAHAEYTELVKVRDRAAYKVAGVAIVSVGFLNLGEVTKAHLALQEAVLTYQLAAEAVEKFHRNEVRKNSQSAAQGGRLNMPLTPAIKEIGYAKTSLFGPKGTGKTTLLAMLLIHLSKTYHNCAPVAWLASEKGVDFVIDIFKAEGVPLFLNRSRSFLDLKSFSRMLWQKCCAAGVDSVSHFWQDLFTEGMKASGPRLARIGRDQGRVGTVRPGLPGLADSLPGHRAHGLRVGRSRDAQRKRRDGKGTLEGRHEDQGGGRLRPRARS